MKETEAQSRWYHRLIPATRADIKRLERLIIMKASELQGALDAINTQISKAQAEIVAEIQTLKDSLANVELPPEATASLTKLQGLAQALDDLNPDQPTTDVPANP